MKTTRTRFGAWLVSQGRTLQGLPCDDTAFIRSAKPEGDRRQIVSKEIAVVISSHARDRYAERTGRMLTGRHLRDELRQVWEHAELSIEPPSWLDLAHRDGEPLQIYASIADMVFPLVPYKDEANCFVATTVLTPDGPPKRWQRRTKSGRNIARRKRIE